jgi:uncharacterized protein involved in exopolysaccharide biosynthesis
MTDDNKLLSLNFLLDPLFNNFRLLLISLIILLTSSTYISFQIPETYKSDSLLLIKDKYEVLNTGSTDLGSALGFLGNSGGSSSDLKIIEMMRSRDFFNQLYSNDEFILHSFFIDSYDKKTGKTLFSDGILQADGKYDLTSKPPLMLAYKEYVKSSIEVAQERETGLIMISSYSPSPSSAKHVLEIVISSFIEYITQRESEMAESSLSFLSSMLEQNNSQLSNSLSKLIQADIQKMVLSKSKDGIIEIIDSPYVPLEKHAPSKLAFILLITFIFISILYISLMFKAYILKSN